MSDKKIPKVAEVTIAENLYLRNPSIDTLWEDTKALRVSNRPVEVYSDINMILVQMTIDTINQKPINEYVYETFYEPMGLRYIQYLPLSKFKKEQIIPTEDDKYWRKQVLYGYVHDPSAAVLGGVAGNAGLFSCANDLGILFQMLVNRR